MAEKSAVETIEILKKDQATLYSELLEDRSKNIRPLKSGKDRDEFVARVNTLLDQLETVGPQIRLAEDYTWAMNATSQLQSLAGQLNIDRKIRIPESGEKLWAPTQRLGTKDIDQWLASQSLHVCRFRHLEEFKARLRNIQIEKRDNDEAKIYLAKDVLSQEMDFVEKIPPGVYPYLEVVWFRDVIRVEAYLSWERKGADLNRPTELAEGDYLESEEIYRSLLVKQDIKCGPEKFVSARDFLREKYLDYTTGQLDQTKVQSMIQAKSQRYEMATEGKKGNDYTNWCQAAEYVEKFYNSVIPAVMHSEEQAKAQLREAILLSEGKKSRFSIMNAFEAAICLYFVKGLKFDPEDWKQ